MCILGKKSYFFEFVRDFGDAVGACMIGYGIGHVGHDFGYFITGSVMITVSWMLEFYYRKELINKNVKQVEK